MLESVAEVQARIAAGKSLLLAGEECLLRQLPRGSWIAGTIPYFMDRSGGIQSDSQIFVNEIPAPLSAVGLREYTITTLPSICQDAPENGFSVIIMPAESPVHIAYAQDFPTYTGAFLKPVVGWIAGVNVAEIGRCQPKVSCGFSGQDSTQNAVVMHVALPAGKHAEIDIVNVFRPGPGDAITFPVSGFTAGECRINGRAANLARYITNSQVDSRLPLTADYHGSIVNVSVQNIDDQAGVVKFYAPVFAGVEYKFARPVADYVSAFNSALPDDGPIATFSCNCILNYLYAGLEGKHTGNLTGPITFGEVAHQLLNQTLVRLLID